MKSDNLILVTDSLRVLSFPTTTSPRPLKGPPSQTLYVLGELYPLSKLNLAGFIKIFGESSPGELFLPP